MTVTLSPEAGQFCLAERVSHLFEVIRKPDGSRYSLREVADGITTRFGARVAFSTIRDLRAGRNANPTLATLRGLAAFFDVPLAYLTGDTTTSELDDADQTALAALRHHPDLTTLIVHAHGLSPHSLHLVLQVLTQIRRAEGLPDIRPDRALPAPHGEGGRGRGPAGQQGMDQPRPTRGSRRFHQRRRADA